MLTQKIRIGSGPTELRFYARIGFRVPDILVHFFALCKSAVPQRKVITQYQSKHLFSKLKEICSFVRLLRMQPGLMIEYHLWMGSIYWCHTYVFILRVIPH